MHSAETEDSPAIGWAEAEVVGSARPATPMARAARTVMEGAGMTTFRQEVRAGPAR